MNFSGIKESGDMDDYKLLVDLHRNGCRQGPGGDAETERALDLARVNRTAPLKIADIGCGTGASAILLTRLLENAQITAVDFLQDFIDELKQRAEKERVADRISTLVRSMDDLPFSDGEFDMIWSEGAIYNIGFERGLTQWRRFLKPEGLLVVSEITWLTDSRPNELQKHWDLEYPEVDLASANIRVLEKCGFSPVGYFVLPERCWLDEYYRPLQAEFDAFLKRNDNCEDARVIVRAEQAEIDLYKKYKSCVSYGVYIARKTVP
jgi:SAM-dependent methyltransferase